MKSEHGSEAHLRKLISGLASADPEVRRDAAILLSAIAEAPARTEEDRRLAMLMVTEAVEPLIRALNDHDSRTRDAAREALDALRFEVRPTPSTQEAQAPTEVAEVQVESRDLTAEVRDQIATLLEASGTGPPEVAGRVGGRPERVEIYFRGELEEEIDARLLEPGKDVLSVPFYCLPWDGENVVRYDFQDGILLVAGKAVGVDLNEWVVQRPVSRDEIAWARANAEHFGDLPGFPNLMAISARDRIADEHLAHVEGLTNLRVLSVGEVHSFLGGGRPDARVTDAGLAYLRKLTKLRELVVDETHVTDAGLVHLADLAALRHLSLAGSRVTDGGLGRLAHLVNLQDLGLRDTSITDAGLHHLARLTNLRTLDLSGTAVRGEGLVHLKGLPDLEVVRLNNAPVSDEGLRNLASLPRLRTLGLSAEQWSLAGEKHPVRRPSFTGRGLGYLASLTTLEALRLSESALTEEGAAGLGRLASLRDLDLTGTPIADAGVAHLGGLTGLRKLGLGRTGIGDPGVAHLKRLTNLEELQLWDTNVTDAAVPLLMHLRHLKALGLGSTRIGGAAVERLRATLPDCEISHSEREPSEEKKSGCFIATAAFGSPEALEVQAFRDLRDQVLARHASGRFVVSLYGRISPPMARFVTRSPAVKSGVRRVLRLLLVLLERRA